MKTRIRNIRIAATLALAILSTACVSSDDMTGEEIRENEAVESGGTPLPQPPPNP